MTDTTTNPLTNKNQPQYCIHIFRRDYRLTDNTSLLTAIKAGYIIIPIFIFTPVQIEDKRNKYKSHSCLRFLIDSLQDLDKQLNKLDSKLHIYYGNDEHIIKTIIQKNDTNKNQYRISAISFNRDYTAYAHKRDIMITKLCHNANIRVITMDDTLLQPLGTVCTGPINHRKPYTKFTPFYRAAKQHVVKKPSKIRIFSSNFLSSKVATWSPITGEANITGKWNHIHTFYDMEKLPIHQTKDSSTGILLEKPGRDAALHRLHQLGEWKQYGECRDQLVYETTHLSAYLKFGCISIREAYWNIRSKLGRTNGEPLLRQLYWRDFFYILSAANPRVYKESLDTRRHDIKWWPAGTNNWKAWTDGMTGYPIVDACMRELNATGYMHNRGRLITSNFLVRLLHINWRDGERYFATHLYDYDPTQNNFGWQVSSAVSGTESRPISQTIYNPWLQARKYDSNAEFIKKWCPELASVPASDLMNWDSKWKQWLDKGCPLYGQYPQPIVDYKEEKKKDGELFGY